MSRSSAENIQEESGRPGLADSRSDQYAVPKAKQLLQHIPCLFDIGSRDMWRVFFSPHVSMNLGVRDATVEHTADGDFMAQAGASL